MLSAVIGSFCSNFPLLAFMHARSLMAQSMSTAHIPKRCILTPRQPLELIILCTLIVAVVVVMV